VRVLLDHQHLNGYLGTVTEEGEVIAKPEFEGE
jgi:hypothetical protein